MVSSLHVVGFVGRLLGYGGVVLAHQNTPEICVWYATIVFFELVVGLAFLIGWLRKRHAA